jgi:hypothetical protein
MGERDFITHRLFQPAAVVLYDWTGIQVHPFTLLVVTVAVLAGVVLYIMKNA